MVLGGHEEKRLARMEEHLHYAALIFPERVLRHLFGYLVHQNGRGPAGGRHRGEVVPAVVPRHLLDGELGANLQPRELAAVALPQVPVGQAALLSRLTLWCEHGASGLLHGFPADVRWQQQQLFVQNHRQDARVCVGAPRHGAHRRAQLPHVTTPPGAHLPQAGGAVVAAAGEPLARGVNTYAPHFIRVTIKRQALPGRERLQVLGLGKLGK
mmetsp:Transcript_15912/g.30520  ORF Transcript_15912/g.30520 Transcript_15912/m.30520 type:complete len:212 (-) Transcript_15912:1158-1793(-)